MNNTPAVNDILETLKSIPDFADLPEDAQKQITKSAIFSNYIDEIKDLEKASRINFEKQKKDFIESFKSPYTKKNYHAALERFESYARKNEFIPQLATPEQADGFIKERRSADISNALVRLDTAACSSFFTFLERRYPSVKNPFRGTRERPEKRTAKKIEIPTEEEVQYIIEKSNEFVSAAVAVMAYRGLRAGALPSLEVIGNHFKAFSKGKETKGTFNKDVLFIINNLPSVGSPFGGLSSGAIEHRIKRATEKFYAKGKIKALYSAHDFRHFYAVTEYKKDFDIYRVSRLLNHTSIIVTENYLRSLDVLE
jgi:site-specific recombinase XerD